MLHTRGWVGCLGWDSYVDVTLAGLLPTNPTLPTTQPNQTKQAVVNMLLRILELKDTPPYGGRSEGGGGGGRGGGRTVTVPESLNGVEILGPGLQRWLLEQIRWVCLVCVCLRSKGEGVWC